MRPGRRDHHPALTCAGRRVYDEGETRRVGEERDCLVVVTDHERHECDRVRHCCLALLHDYTCTAFVKASVAH